MYRGGYTGKVLRINLTDKTHKEEPLPLEVAQDFIGGSGITVKYLYEEVPPDCDPLGPENKLIYAPGPITGSTIPCASRMAINAKSPATGAVGVATTGGHFPVEMKRAGYDVIIIEGKAEEPTYLYIKNGDVKFRPADKIWGLCTTDTQMVIKDELHDQNIRISCIGPAGEKLSKMAAIVNERRVAGRKGLGAVMGSKNLKAIALRGDLQLDIADKQKYDAARKRMRAGMQASPILYPQFSRYGTSTTLDLTQALGIYPAMNWAGTGVFTPADKIGGFAIEALSAGKTACAGCPVGCSQMRLAQQPPYTGVFTEGPEYETLYSFGGVTGVDNPDAIIAADRLSDELGIDTISAGVTIAFAMELFEKGILTLEDTGGMDLSFGNDESMIKLLGMMGERQGLGDLLADGTRAAAEKIGKGSEKYAMHIKGLELPGYDIRGAKAHGLSMATAFTGADHNKGYAFQEIFGIPIPYQVDRLAIEGKGKLTKWNQDARTVIGDSSTMCVFLMDMAVADFMFENTADIMEGLTGLKYTPEEVHQVGERINNLARVFNILAGLSRADDDLPERLKTEPIKDGSSKGELISQADLDTMLDEYYEARGWTVEGIPTRAKLEELRLGYAADRLGI
ncbi:MAG: aldehyde ferredoxin oxidoreductase family protein [Thermoleophilia bacterium]|nr:aldehyde ferredoxin oxidoreductase family protein [Thermoleophilia bacterium]